jgi:protein involved in polysaccharide export with SLBB domain
MRSALKSLLWLVLLIPYVGAVNADSIHFRAGDTIEVTVYNAPELSGAFRINNDGYIRMPLAGKIQAAGKTEDELNEAIRSSVDTFIKNPNITVIPKFSVSVLGAVTKPGTFTLIGSERVIEVIAMAGGFNNDASGKITLYRNGKKKLVFKSTSLYTDSALGFLQPGDVLVVNNKRLTRADFSIIFSTMYSLALTIYYISNR